MKQNPLSIPNTTFTIIYILLVSSFLGPCFGQNSKSIANRKTVQIWGKIIDFQKRVPLQGVQIRMADTIDTTSDAEGDYNFTVHTRDESEIKIHFSHEGYSTISDTIRLNNATRYQVDVQLIRQVFRLNDDIVVTARRIQENPHDIPTLITVISTQDIQEKSIAQTPELLRGMLGVAVQKTNQGGGSPIIRGFKSNKILFMIDGIRMNNSTYRGGNFQYLNTIDAQLIERIEVVHGPNAVMYGSDALGGVIQALTVQPDVSENTAVSGAVNTQLSTADETRTLHGQVIFSQRKWAGMISGGYNYYGDVRRGNQGGKILMQRLINDSRTSRTLQKIQRPNNYWAYDLNTAIRYRPDATRQFITSYQRNRQINVPRYDVIETQTDSLRLFSPQKRDLFYIKYTQQARVLFFDNISATISWHRQFERRRRIRKAQTIENVDQFGVHTLGVLLQFSKLFSSKQHLIYGMDLYYDRVGTHSYGLDIVTLQRTAISPLFPNGSTFIQNGWYIQNNWSASPRWSISPGIRLSLSRLRAPFSNDPSLPVQFGTTSQISHSFTGSVGIRYQVSPEINLVSNIAQGFRTPNLDDTSKLGGGKGGTIYEIPNQNLNPEETISIDGGVKIQSRFLNADLFLFYNKIHNLLIRKPTSINGTTTIIDQGDTLALFHKTNAGRAFNTGFEIGSQLKLRRGIAISGRMHYTYGENITDQEPLSGIPPMSGLAEISWQGEDIKTDLSFRFVFAQNRLSAIDKLDLRIPEGGSSRWHTVNWRISKEIHSRISISLAFNNIFDMNYREHLSGLNAPGRNLIFGARSRF